MSSWPASGKMETDRIDAVKNGAIAQAIKGASCVWHSARSVEARGSGKLRRPLAPNPESQLRCSRLHLRYANRTREMPNGEFARYSRE
jgi:hypothetical protein